MSIQGTQFGVNVWWTLPETVVDGVRAQSLLKKHGFDMQDMKLPSRQLEVSRAIQSFHNRRSKNDRRLGERVKDTQDSVVYGILEREQAGEEVAFEQHTTVKLDKATGEVSAQGTLTESFNKALGEYQGKVTDADIRTFLRNVIRMSHGVAKRPSGGIYFVPVRFAMIIEQAQALLAEFNTAARIYVERVMDGTEERQNVWEAVESEVEDKIAKAVAAVGQIERLSAIQGHREDIEEAEKLMIVYQQLLGEEAKYETLAEKIEDAVQIVSEKIAAVQSAVPQKVRTKTVAPVVPAAPVAAPVEVPVVVPDDTVAYAVTGAPVVIPVAPVAPVAQKVKRGGSIVEATVNVLVKAGKPMSYREIVDEAIKSGLYATSCAFPYNAFHGTLMKALTAGEKRVRKIGRGVYEIAA